MPRLRRSRHASFGASGNRESPICHRILAVSLSEVRCPIPHVQDARWSRLKKRRAGAACLPGAAGTLYMRARAGPTGWCPHTSLPFWQRRMLVRARASLSTVEQNGGRVRCAPYRLGPRTCCEIESTFPSGSLNQATRSPLGGVHTPCSSCSGNRVVAQVPPIDGPVAAVRSAEGLAPGKDESMSTVRP